MALTLGWWLLPFAFTLALCGGLAVSLALDKHKSLAFVIGLFVGPPLIAAVSLVAWTVYLIIAKWDTVMTSPASAWGTPAVLTAAFLVIAIAYNIIMRTMKIDNGFMGWIAGALGIIILNIAWITSLILI